MSKMSGIYSITNTVNGKRNIGQSMDIRNRWNGHRGQLRRGFHPNRHLQAAWNKHGEDAFVFEVLEHCAPENLDEAESRLIAAYRTTDRAHGYNMMGGGHAPRHSEESRRRMSIAKLGKKSGPHSEHTKMLMRVAKLGKPGHPQSEATKAKISKAFRGSKSPNWGRHIPASVRLKISQSETGKIISDVTRAKMSAARMGLPVSQETRDKIRKALMGNTNGAKHREGADDQETCGCSNVILNTSLGERESA